MFNHLSEDEVSKVEKALAEKQEWYDKKFALSMNLKKTDDPPVIAQQILTERQVCPVTTVGRGNF